MLDLPPMIWLSFAKPSRAMRLRSLQSFAVASALLALTVPLVAIGLETPAHGANRVLCLRRDESDTQSKAQAREHAKLMACLLREPVKTQRHGAQRWLQRCLSEQGEVLFAGCEY
jgi:hypothetical protein